MNKIIEFFRDNDSTLINFLKTLLIVIVFLLILVNIINAIFRRARKSAEKKGKNSSYLMFVKYVLLVLIYIAAIFQVISTIPALNSLLTTILAGSGVAAIIISVAAQEPISNLVSGLIILFSRSTKVGDTVKYVDKDISGVIEEITLNHTTIRTFENKRVIIPNSILNSTVIENSSYLEDKICMMMDFDVTYESDLQLAKDIISDVVLLHPDYFDNRTEEEKIEGEPAVRVLITDFKESSVNIRAWVWAENMPVSLKMKNDILTQVHRRFMESGIGLAYPHMTVQVEEAAK